VKDESWIDKYRAEGGCFEDIGEFREISLLPEVRGRTGFRRIETRDKTKDMKVLRNGKVKEVNRPRRTTNKTQGDFYLGHCWLCGQECLCEDLDNDNTRHLPLSGAAERLLQ